MNGDELAKVIGALAGGLVLILGALGVLYRQVAEVHRSVNSRMDQLLESRESAAHARGKLEGPDSRL